MKRLEVTTFSGIDIRIDGQPIRALSAHKTQALLVYLAVTKQKQTRQTLSGLLWGEMPEAKARRNLRVALSRIRNKLEDYLTIKRRSLAINFESNIFIDALEFESCLTTPNPTVAQLQRAANLYQGDFLNGFNLRDAPSFEVWMRHLEERYRIMAMEAIYQLALHYTDQHQYSTAVEYTQRLLHLEPWMEEAHRQLMYLFAISGQRTAALAQYETCQNLLWEELGVDPTAETIALYEKISNGEILPEPQSAVTLSPPPVPTKPIQIPATSEHFVGRSAILKSIRTQLTKKQGNPIQALIGMGGVGKSTLAVQVAKAAQEDFPDGILWANAASSEPMAVLESWAAAYGYDFTRIADLESMAAAFRGVLTEKQALIVLDDVISVSRIRPLLPGGNQCRVLLTTRDQDLAHALNANIWQVQELSPANGRLLLSSILGEGRVAAEPAAADTICSLLHNLPLAVEITAQRLKSRPRRLLKDMAQRLRDETQRLSLLKISDREVRASFTLSWEALDAERQRVFALIGLFNGRHFTSEAMAHIAQLQRFPVEDRLFDLINLSLLRAEGERLYYQHPLLADFAREKLGEELAAGNGRFSEYYLLFATQHQDNFDAIRQEWDNLKAAVKITDKYQLRNAVIDFAEALRNYCFRQGRYSRARKIYKLAYEAALVLEDNAKAADSLLWWGKAAAEQHNHDSARRRLEQSRDLYQKLQNLNGYADCQCQLARVALEQSRYQDALKLSQESRSIRQELKDDVGVAETYYVEARVAYFQADYSQASQIAEKAIELQERFEDREGLIYTLSLSGSIANQNGHLDRAAQFTEQAIQLCDEIDNQSDKSMLLGVLAETNRKQGKLEEAETIAIESLDMLKRFGDLGSQAQLYYQISLILLDKEQLEEALEITDECLSLSRQVEYLVMEGLAQYQLGRVYIALKNYTKAPEHLEEAIKIGRKLNHKTLVSKSQELLGETEQLKKMAVNF